MIGKEVESEQLVTLNEAKEILEERKKTKELNYEQQLAYEHAKKFASGLEKKKEDALREKLVALGVSEKTAIKIIDILPESAILLKQMLVHESSTFSDADAAKMLEAIKGK